MDKPNERKLEDQRVIVTVINRDQELSLLCFRAQRCEEVQRKVFCC
jgi:hypothetical protein